ncbi:MAG: polysaccharide biosynthesis tyrosine autokinase [bacterium]
MENFNIDRLREPEHTTIKDYVNLIRQNFLPILIITSAALAVSILYAVNAIDIYKSTTVLKISKPTGSVLEGSLMPEFSDFGSDRFIANEIEILKSYTTREKVAKTLIDSFNTILQKNKFYIVLNRDFIKDKNTRETIPISTLTKLLASHVAIDQKRGLDIVEITAESPSAYESQLIANIYAAAYKELNLMNNRQMLNEVTQFLKNQRVNKLDDLNLAEEKLKLFQQQGGIVVLSDQAKALIDQLSSFEAQRNAVEIDLMISKNTLAKYKEELDKQNPRIKEYIENAAAELRRKSLQDEIARFETQRDVALANNKDSRQRQELLDTWNKKINELKDKLDVQLRIYQASIFASSPEEIKQLTQKVLEEEVKYQSLQSSFNELNKIVGEYSARFSRMPEKAIESAKLEREQAANEKLYLLVEERFQEAMINEQSTPGNVLLIDYARTPELPAKPNRIMIVLIGLVMGMGMGFGFAFLRNYFDSTIKTPEDIQKKNISVLAWIPQIDGLSSESKEFEFVVGKRPDSIPSEAFRALRTRVQFSKVGKDATRTILVTSSAPREGKTTVSVNLAGSFAQANKRTVIVDCDLRKPRVHTIFKDNRYPGFSDYFFEQASYEQIIRKSELENLFYITAGTIPPNPSEILGSPQMVEFIEELKKDFDLIVLDSPPIIAVTDSEILSRMVDATILVVSANLTENDLMQKSVELLTHEHGSFIGVLLNNFSYKGGYGSYYKYYYYYSKPSNGQGQNKKSSKLVKSSKT